MADGCIAGKRERRYRFAHDQPAGDEEEAEDNGFAFFLFSPLLPFTGDLTAVMTDM